MGCHTVLNYKDSGFKKALKSVGLVDVYFDNGESPAPPDTTSIWVWNMDGHLNWRYTPVRTAHPRTDLQFWDRGSIFGGVEDTGRSQADSSSRRRDLRSDSDSIE